jgi:hypothetical protein
LERRVVATLAILALATPALAQPVPGRGAGCCSLTWKSLELYSEGEYVFDLESSEGDSSTTGLS